MIRFSFRLLLISFIFTILLYEGVESKRGGGSRSGGSGRGSSGSRSSSSGRSSSGSSGGWGGGSKSSGSSGSKSSWGSSGSGSRSSSSSNWGSSSHSSSGGGSYSKPSYGSSGRGWGNRYNGNTYVVMRTHTYYSGGGYGGSVYSSRSGSSAAPSTPIQQSQQSESPTVTTETIRGVLFPGGKPAMEIFNFDEPALRITYDDSGNMNNFQDTMRKLMDINKPAPDASPPPTVSNLAAAQYANYLKLMERVNNDATPVSSVEMLRALSPHNLTATNAPNFLEVTEELRKKDASDLLRQIEALKDNADSPKNDLISELVKAKNFSMFSQYNSGFDPSARKKRDHEQMAKQAIDLIHPKDEVVHIKDEEEPVLVGSISFFWGDDYLPEGDNETDCVDFSPVNDAANYTICNVTSMIRCEKSLAEVFVLGKKEERLFSGKMIDRKIIVKTANETSAEFFAWFCPPSDKCCEWECCSSVEKQHEEFDPPDDDFVFFIHAMIIIAIIVISIPILYLLRHCVMKHSSSDSDREVQQLQVEMQPLNPQYRQMPPGQDYPKQQRSNPDSANYGWNPNPSAPSM